MDSIWILYGSYMDPSMDPTWTLYMDPIWIHIRMDYMDPCKDPRWTIYGSPYESYMDHIWIPYGSLYGLYGYDPFVDHIWIPVRILYGS